MGKRLSSDEFIEKAKQIHGDKYDYSKVNYINNREKVCIICKEHGEFWIRPDGHLNKKQGCSKCANNYKPSNEEWVEKAKKVHGDRYDYSKSIYSGRHKKLEIICREHGSFLQTAGDHLNGQGCPICGGKKPITNKDIIERFRTVHGDKFDYSKVNYVNNHTLVNIICPTHGDFYQAPSVHEKGCGCPKCSGNYNMSTEEFIEKAKEVHGDKYDYSKTEYVNNSTDVIIICPKHGEFKQTPHSHLVSKIGCPKCANVFRKDTEYFINELKKIFDDKYDYSKVDYKNAKTKVCVICPKHGEFFIKPNNLLNGRGCPICNESKLERAVRKIFQNNDIKFEYQKRFNWLGLQTIDFYLPLLNLAIECQGIQHIRDNDFFNRKGIVYSRDRNKYKLLQDNNVDVLYVFDDNINEEEYLNNDKIEIYNKENTTKLQDLLNIIKGITK